MLQYFRKIKFNNLTFSIDNVVLDYAIGSQPYREQFVKLLEELPLRYRCEVINWQTFKMGAFRLQFKILLPDGNSFWIGVGLNQAKTNFKRIRLDFNPNKIANHAPFREILIFLNTKSKRMHTCIPRYDLAIDIPIERENVFLMKDNRAYSERRHGKEWTSYLGKSSNVGRVKLYNKQVESKLSYPLTRLELTLDYQQSFPELNFPKVYYINTSQMHIDELSMTDTDRFILQALLTGHGGLPELGRKTRKKMEQILTYYTKTVRLDQKVFDELHRQLTDLMDFPSKPLPDDTIIFDKTPMPSAGHANLKEILIGSAFPFLPPHE